MGTPLYDAGVDRGDRILSIAGVAMSTRAELDGVWASGAPGDPVEIHFQSRGESLTVTVPLAADPALAGRWLPESAVSAGQAAFRTAWKAPTGR